MSLPIKSFPVVALAAVLALAFSLMLSAVVVPVATADAAKLTACVNKKNGNVKMRFGKKAKRKCPKGWRKISWNDSRTSTVPSVYGADGSRVGKFIGSGFLFAPWPLYNVQRSGGQYLYDAGTGEMMALFGSPAYQDAGCAGDAVLQISAANPLPVAVINRYQRKFQGTFRWVFRTENALGDLGAPLVWTGDGTSQHVAGINLFVQNDETGACEPDSGGAFTGMLFGMSSVQAPFPYDFPGPLSIR